jgi:tyrosyl-tRNA synthetase
MTVEEQLARLLPGTADIVPEGGLAVRLAQAAREGRPLRVKLGLDPSVPDLHLGHSVVLRKLRQFQDLGHEVQLIIGDFTAIIGDPSGRSETRRPLTPDEVHGNARTYEEQYCRILDPARTRVFFNSQWLGTLTTYEVVRLTSTSTVARLLERDDFSRRFQEGHPIAVHELLYAFCQAYDSVHLRADVEMGGTDQRFNILMGRDVQRAYGQEPQVALIMPILVGLDGVQKMSKSLGNYIGISEPPRRMFEKVMSITDAMMPTFFACLTECAADDVEALIARNPMETKKTLAETVVATYHGAEPARAARQEWEQIHSRREVPDDVPERPIDPAQVDPTGRIWIVRLLQLAELVGGTNEGRRAVEQGAVQIDGQRCADVEARIEFREGMLVQIGRRRFARLVLAH